jgi:hypothetical protein
MRFSLPAVSRLMPDPRVLVLASVPVILAPVCSVDTERNPVVSEDPPERWVVHLSPESPPAIGWTADDLERYLGEMGLTVERSETLDEPGCRASVGDVVLVGDGLSEARLDTNEPTDQTWRIEETRCDRGRLIELSGGGLLGRQVAAYEWLHGLGVRFFHPEEEFIPEEPWWSETPLFREHTPPFRFRSVSLHLTHPLELGDAFRLEDEDAIDEARRYVDWQVKNGASNGTTGIPEDGLRDYGIQRGFPTGAGFSLYGVQQGGRPVIDPDDPRPWREQVAAAIDERMGDDPERYPEVFSFTFNPTEFMDVVEVDDTLIVEQLTFIAEYFAEHYPDTILMTTNHGSHGEPTDTYGVRFFDLPRFAPANLGVKVHTLMFYDLFRPAPVYGNEDFGFLYDFMEAEYRTRRLWYFPEAAWWLTFDIAVPIYLPITIEARDRDIQGIAHMLEGGLDGHHVFGTGHEWGYWQNEYCSFRMAMDLETRWQDCVADIAAPMGAAAGEVADVLEAFIVQQERDIISSGILPYLVGTDPETEVADSIGVVVHPLPPAPAEVMRWDEDQVRAWLDEVLPALELMDRDCAAHVERLEAASNDVSPRARPFFEEIRDGIEVTGLRARHGWQVYGALVLLRDGQLRLDEARMAEARQWLDDAAATTEDALEVIHRRERGYRYRPLERSIAGGPDGTEDDNWTIYHYRYLNRTHHGYYYTRIDEMAAEAFAVAAEPVVLDDALIGSGEVLSVRVADPELTDVEVDFGDGASGTGSVIEHEYAAPGYYEVAVSARRGAEEFSLDLPVAVLSEERRTGFTGAIVEPAGADLISSVMPGLVVGAAGDDGLAVGFATEEERHAIDAARWFRASPAPGSPAPFETEPLRLVVPVVTHSTGEVMASIVVEDGVVTVADEEGPLVITGQLSTDAVIDAVVAIGGFDETGARDVVAATLGYTADTLPELVAFRAEYAVE